MEKIASFTVDHLRLEPGVYLSRKDIDPVTKACVSTFDLRMTAPNREPVINIAELHTIEHMGATFLRNDPQWAPRAVYFGPMGCRTGYYLVVFGDYSSRDVLDLVIRLFEFIRDYTGAVPGAAAAECGNYLDHNLSMAQFQARKYLDDTLYGIDDTHLSYQRSLFG